jgi:hypothetical protein
VGIYPDTTARVEHFLRFGMKYLVFFILLIGCDEEPSKYYSGDDETVDAGDTDTDSDSGGDTDTDANTDTDSGSDTDTDTNTDSNSDSDSDTDTSEPICSHDRNEECVYSHAQNQACIDGGGTLRNAPTCVCCVWQEGQ